MLVHFNLQKEFKLMVDASNVAVGGILLQLEKHWRPIFCFKHKLLKYQLAYTVTEKNCLTVIIGLCKYRHYLDRKEFLIVSDQHVRCSLLKTNARFARLHRWAVLLFVFRYKSVYTKSEDHPSDCLLRVERLETSSPLSDELFNCLHKTLVNKLELKKPLKQNHEEAYINLVSTRKFIDCVLANKKNHQIFKTQNVVMTFAIYSSPEIKKF
jgi:pol protein